MPTETSRLLGELPSANSNEEATRLVYSGSHSSLPLASSYQDLSAEIQLEALDRTSSVVQKKGSGGGDVFLAPAAGEIRRRPAICMLLLGCLLSVGLLAYPHLRNVDKYGDIGDLPADFQDYHPRPLSRHDPVRDLGILAVERPEETAPPAHLFRRHHARVNGKREALPTNAWYQNMLMPGDEPNNINRAYASPYIVDAVGLIPGLRLMPNRIDSGNLVMQLALGDNNGMTLGSVKKNLRKHDLPTELSHKYSVLATTELGLTLGWDDYDMESNVLRGMPFASMKYNTLDSTSQSYPTLSSPLTVAKVWIDGKRSDVCSPDNQDGDDEESIATLYNDMELYFGDSDFTWMVFASEPVQIQCVLQNGATFIQVLDKVHGGESSGKNDAPFMLRLAVLEQCTTGSNDLACRRGLGHYLPSTPDIDVVRHLLRKHADYYPGNETSIKYIVNDDTSQAEIVFDWNVQRMSDLVNNNKEDDGSTLRRGANDAGSIMRENGLIMFALSHHLDLLDASVLPDGTLYCKSTLIGPSCLVAGNEWSMQEELFELSFRAPRHPRPDYIPAIADALKKDISFKLPKFFRNGAGDTYFSGKMIAKLARILLIYEEVHELCHGHGTVNEYAATCSNATLPSRKEYEDAIARLKASTEIWINGTAVTPFVYDPAWGGIVSCGCDFHENTCLNVAPDCPAFMDQGLNFGNAFYNDQHFHYGYHIYAAAALAHFDHQWGKDHFEQVLLLVRSIANPSREDTAFPLYRHKDWYQGSSWASGVPRPPYLNGKNQESSSEAIAGYEAVGLFGQVMSEIWKEDGNDVLSGVSDAVRKIGQVMTATEIRSTQRYWHVRQNDERKRIYPEIYKQNVIGILWSTMAQFGTWFGAAPYLPYGIQLLPLTPVSEYRDDLAWANEMYYPFSEGCSQDFQCTRSGWVILQLAILATVGHVDVAAGRVEGLPNEAYTNAGGNGQSKSNTLWYVSTRPLVANPIPLDETDLRGSDEKRPAPVYKLTDCHVPEECTDEVLDSMAGAYTCRERITFLIDSMGQSQWEACSSVGGLEYPSVCGPCNPNISYEEPPSEDEELDTSSCPPCSEKECQSELNRCPVFERIFVCSGGQSYGGCNDMPWDVSSYQCSKCCEMTNCQSKHDVEAFKITKDIVDPKLCPPCEKKICYGKINQCPLHSAPYLCTSGKSVGGCSHKPWEVSSDNEACSECCEVTTDC